MNNLLTEDGEFGMKDYEPLFEIDDIRYALSPQTVKKAYELYPDGVCRLRISPRGYFALVQGSKLYEVSVSRKDIWRSECSCYAGKEGTMCKHVLATALAAIQKYGGGVSGYEATYSDKLKDIKPLIAKHLRKICAYNGNSREWFVYSAKLFTASAVITDAVSELAPTKENARYLWELVLRISKKLAIGGVDDSDGAVGNCADAIVRKIIDMCRRNSQLLPLLEKFAKKDTGFGFEDALADFVKTQK